MKQQIIKLSKIVENKGQIEGLPRNPRQIKDEKYKLLKKSIEDDPEMLELRELLVYPHNNKFVVIGGNMRLKALRELGVAECPCKVIPAETPVEKLRAYTIKDNNSFGEYDFDLLGNDWEVDELLDWGCDLPDITIEEETKEAVEDDYSEEDAQNAESIVKRGEIWQLGEHRLMCGDSTCGGDAALLMNGGDIDLVFTDPPYGNGTHGKYGRGQLGIRTIQGDENLDAFEKVVKNSNFDKIIYFLQWRTIKESFDILEQKQLKINTVGVWDKKIPGLNGGGGFGEQWEAVIFAGNLKYTKFGGNVFEITRETKRREDSPHPHQKPIKLLAEILSFIENSQKIYDPFGGSGSTLIACEQLKRKCYMMELDEHYCDVIIDRWQKLTGKTAVKIEQQ